jgi:hypothetical protein
MQPANCLNCGENLTGPFCNQCGQKETHRYTVGHVLHELVHVFTHADKGIFSFAWTLVKKPGLVALDYVEGRRKRHFNLFQYLLIVVGISTFVVTKTNYLETIMSSAGVESGQIPSERIRNFQTKSGSFMKEHSNLLMFLLIPLFSFFTWLITKRKKYNYAETLVLQTSINAGITTISTALLLFLFIIPTRFFGFYNAVSLMLTLFYFSFGYMQFYKLSFFKSLLFALFSIVCAYIIFSIIIALIMVVYVMSIKGG